MHKTNNKLFLLQFSSNSSFLQISNTIPNSFFLKLARTPIHFQSTQSQIHLQVTSHKHKHLIKLIKSLNISQSRLPAKVRIAYKSINILQSQTQFLIPLIQHQSPRSQINFQLTTHKHEQLKKLITCLNTSQSNLNLPSNRVQHLPY